MGLPLKVTGMSALFAALFNNLTNPMIFRSWQRELPPRDVGSWCPTPRWSKLIAEICSTGQGGLWAVWGLGKSPFYEVYLLIKQSALLISTLRAGADGACGEEVAVPVPAAFANRLPALLHRDRGCLYQRYHQSLAEVGFFLETGPK